jgi:hypothetical protein
MFIIVFDGLAIKPNLVMWIMQAKISYCVMPNPFMMIWV